MVDYHDPATVAQEFGAYAFPSGFRGWQHDLLLGLFNSEHREALARREWDVYVSLHALPRRPPGSARLLNLRFQLGIRH
jgi:hypothetical protein